MNNWIFFGLITLSVLVSSIQCTPGHINVTSAKIHYVNSKYMDNNTYKLHLKKNKEGYTAVGIDLDVLKDFPRDTEVTVRLTKSKHENGPWEDVQYLVIKMCDPTSKYYNFLPQFVIELTKTGKCIPKRQYNIPDVGQINFAKLIPSVVGSYLTAYYQLRAPGVLLFDMEMKSSST